MTTSLAQTDVADVQRLLDSPLTPKEKEELQASELAISMAGKTILEQRLILGKHFKFIYDNALFRGEGGRSFEQWAEERLPQLFPEAGGLGWVNKRRWLFEVRELIHSSASGAVALPETLAQAEALCSLIPRRYESAQAGWNPSDFTKDHAVAPVWQLSLKIGQKQQRQNGPTTQDVRNAREELRPQLTEQGLIREMPKQFQQSAAERMAAAATRRQQTIDVKTPEQTAEEKQQFDEIMADVKRRAPEIAAQNRAAAIKEELNRPSKERQAELEDYIRKYNSKLNGAVASMHELLSVLKEISNIHGTEYLDDMRAGNVAGLLTVQDDLERLRSLGTELMQVVELANSSTPPTGIDMTTFEVEAE